MSQLTGSMRVKTQRWQHSSHVVQCAFRHVLQRHQVQSVIYWVIYSLYFCCLQTLRKASVSVTDPCQALCCWHGLYCKVDKYFRMKQCICTCPGVTDGWFPSFTEDIPQTVFWSPTSLSVFPLAEIEVGKETPQKPLGLLIKSKRRIFFPGSRLSDLPG